MPDAARAVNVFQPNSENATDRLGRLKKRLDFLRVARHGRSRAMPGLVLQVGKRERRDGMRESDDGIRIGFTVTRKIGNAVVRNRVRRRLRAVADAVMPDLAAPGHDYVLIGRAGTVHRPFDALTRDLKRALRALRTTRAIGEIDEKSDR